MRFNSGWYVYIVRCADGTLYTGVTTDLVRRVRQHNGEIRGGAKYTSTRRPVVLVGAERHPDRSSAQKREYRIKRMSRKRKLALCDNELGLIILVGPEEVHAGDARGDELDGPDEAHHHLGSLEPGDE